ncbi:MAG: four-carbon acid sugar kinase family protein [Candidatus Izemoplasmataceae bacterium]
MKNVFIIADDTTGANSSAILHKTLGYDCVSIHTEVKEIRKQSVYAFSTNSRGIDQEKAYQVVKNTLFDLPIEDAIYAKRVDSTLRGNLGRELDAFLDHFQEKKAIVVASFPSSGRICKHNTLYVNGELLETTDVAKDPKMPVNTSIVTSLIQKQTKRSIGHVDLDTVRGEMFDQVLHEAYQKYDIVVVDAVENTDIKRIADSAVKQSLDIVTVDPGPFTYYYARSWKEHEEFKFYCLIGSVTQLTLKQMRYASERGAFVYELDVLSVLSDEHEEYLKKVYQELLSIKNDFIIITTSSLSCDQKISLQKHCKEHQQPEDVSNLINKRIAQLFIEFVYHQKPHCVYTSGGDTTLEFLSSAESYGLRMNSEIMPLTVESQLLGGPFEGLRIVSKGGLIGEEDAIMHIYHYMKVGK